MILLVGVIFTQSNNVTITKSEYTSYEATAYCHTGIMANGKRVHANAVAADPRVLRLGSKIYIKDKGIFTVEDTGGAIKGRRLDIWMKDCSDARQWGRRTVLVKTL